MFESDAQFKADSKVTAAQALRCIGSLMMGDLYIGLFGCRSLVYMWLPNYIDWYMLFSNGSMIYTVIFYLYIYLMCIDVMVHSLSCTKTTCRVSVTQ